MEGYARFEGQPSGVPTAFYNTNNRFTESEDVAKRCNNGKQ